MKQVKTNTIRLGAKHTYVFSRVLAQNNVLLLTSSFRNDL